MIIGRELHFKDPLNPVNRCQVTRAWWRASIDGPCDYEIKVTTQVVEFEVRVGDRVASGPGHLTAYDGTYYLGLEAGQALWLRAPECFREPVEFTLTTRAQHPAKGYTTVAEDAQRLMDRGNSKPQTWCGCGKHSFPADADPYAAHRVWLGRHAPSCHEDGDMLRLQLTGAVWFDVVMRGKGIGISAPPRHAKVLVEIDHPDYA